MNSEEFQNKSEGLLGTYGIRSFPTFTFHVDRAEVERMVGANPTKLEETVGRLEVSMEDKRLEAALYLSTAEADAKPSEKAEAEGGSSISDPLVLKMKRVTGELFDVTVDKTARVIELKKAVADNQKISVECQKLIFKGKLLKDDQTMDACGLKEDGLTVHVAVTANAKSGGEESQSSAASGGGAKEGSSGNYSENRHTEERKRLRDALTTFVTANGREKARSAILVMLLYVRNIQTHPGEAKYRSIRKKNSKYMSTIGKCEGADDVMKCLGFKEEARNNGEMFWVFGIMDLPPLRREIDDTLQSLASPVNAPQQSNNGATATSNGGSPAMPPQFPSGNPFAGFNPFLQPGQAGAAQSPFGSAAGGANPLFSPEMIQGLMSNPAVQNMMQNLQRSGGIPDLASMMNDDNMRNMMQNMMNSPGFAQMLSNPDLLNSLNSFGAGMNGNAFNFDPSMIASMFQPNTGTQSSSASSGNTNSSNMSSAGGSAPNSTSNSNADDEDDLSDLDDIYTE